MGRGGAASCWWHRGSWLHRMHQGPVRVQQMEALQEQWVSINGYLRKVLKREVFCKTKIASSFFFILALKNNLLTKLCCVCSAPERHLTALACGFSAAVCTQSLQVRLRSQGRGSAPHLQLPTFTSQQRLQGSAPHQFRQHQFSIKLLHACSYRSKFPHGQLA